MNYRHHFHAGNFADVVKHAVLVRIVRSMQAKERGFLYVDTHAGRGRYDLVTAARGEAGAKARVASDEVTRPLGRVLRRVHAHAAEVLTETERGRAARSEGG